MMEAFPTSFGDTLAELPEPIYQQMLAIAKELAETDTYIWTGDRMECLFCDTSDFPVERMRDHQPDCIVTKARALVAQKGH